MKNDFWLERWQLKQIVFHQDEINPYLLQFWSALQLPAASGVFVPLCGKSLDMLWLRRQGHAVLGVELSPLAVQDFFAAHNHTPQRLAHPQFDIDEADEIRLLCGDFFAMQASDVAHIKAVYDRAALVALPPEMRVRYVAHLVAILPPATQILLVTFDYPQTEMSGPPFAVSAAEVNTLFAPHGDIQQLAELDVLAQNPRFRERGVSRIQENIFRITLR